MSSMPHGFSVRHACFIRIVSLAKTAPLSGPGLLAEGWRAIGPMRRGLQTFVQRRKVQKAYFETFTIIQTLLFSPGMLD